MILFYLIYLNKMKIKKTFELYKYYYNIRNIKQSNIKYKLKQLYYDTMNINQYQELSKRYNKINR